MITTKEMIELSIIFVWLACLAAYLSSQRQKVLESPIEKRVAWAIFIILLVNALVFACEVYIFPVAVVFVIALVMMSWLLMIFIYAHQFLKFIPYLITLGLLCSLLINFGGEHVV